MNNVIRMTHSSRYHYSGISDDMFDRYGVVRVMDCPYHTKGDFSESIKQWDGFLHEHFLNNVELPSGMELTMNDMVWYDPSHDVWIMLSDGNYHLFV